MQNRCFSVRFVAGLWLLLATNVVAANPSPGSRSWQLDVKFHDPQRIQLRLPGEAHYTTYWYMLYEVTNNTGQDRPFFPSFRLVTETLKVVEGGADDHPLVYDAIGARHKEEFPFLAPRTKVVGSILQGDANARASAAVFRTFDPDADVFTIYAAGFSGEIERLPNPAFDAKEEESPDNPRFFILRRTLAIRYELPGDATTRSKATPIRRTRQWVMR